MVDAFAELTLETRDVALLERFYSDGRARLGLWTPGGKEFCDQGGRHVHFVLSVTPGRLDELATRLRRLGPVRGPVEHPGGDRSIYLEDPAGNVVEVWDFFRRGNGAREGVGALR